MVTCYSFAIVMMVCYYMVCKLQLHVQFAEGPRIADQTTQQEEAVRLGSLHD